MEERAIDNERQLPITVRVFLRVLFREGPVVLAFMVMLGVILGMITSPYLGTPLDCLLLNHKEQLVVLQEIRDDLKKWHTDDERRR